MADSERLDDAVQVTGIPDEVILFASSDTGSRIATRVRVLAGAFAFQLGTVVRFDHPGSIRVRLESGITLPFGRSELEVVTR